MGKEAEKQQQDKAAAKAAVAVLRRFTYTAKTRIANVWLENSPSLVEAVEQELMRLQRAISNPRSLKRIFRRRET
jgi:DNA-binding TFAR19-related protein (PDSD5 family)